MSAVERQGEDRSTPGIWLRLEDEPIEAYTSFVVYREQTPPRSIARVAKDVGKGERGLMRHSQNYRWVERATAYTDHLDQLLIQAHEDDLVARRRAVNEQIFGAAQEVHILAMARLMGVEGDDKNKPVAALDPNSLDPDDIIRWLEWAAKWSRLSIGLPADMTGATVITLQDLAAILKGFFAEAENRMPRGEFEAFVRACYAFIQERLGA